MKVKTSELIGPALDWAVAICEGYTNRDGITLNAPKTVAGWIWLSQLNYSTAWNIGGPIIEQENITIISNNFANYPKENFGWFAQKSILAATTKLVEFAEGPTPLIAAMRCFVASKLGTDIEIPQL